MYLGENEEDSVKMTRVWMSNMSLVRDSPVYSSSHNVLVSCHCTQLFVLVQQRGVSRQASRRWEGGEREIGLQAYHVYSDCITSEL